MTYGLDLEKMVGTLKNARKRGKLRSISNDIVQSPSGHTGLLNDLLKTLQQG